MPTISQQLTELVNQKNILANNLVAKGVEASTDETLNTLVPKVLDIQTGGGTNKLTQLVDRTITEVTIDELQGLTKIGSHAFYACNKLTTVYIPKTIETINQQGFWGCAGLTNIIFEQNSTLKEIASSAFGYCQKLANIELPNSLNILRSQAFFSCYALTNIIIPSNVNFIESQVFYGCNKLTEITILAVIPPTLSNKNAISSATTKIYIPSGTLEAYQTATNWSNFADLFEELPE